VRDHSSTARLYFAMTLVEMLITMTLLLVVFAAIVPQIRAIQNSWASKRQNVEVIQNGRVLMDHITFNLTQAQKITAVSDSSQTNGYIEFEDHHGNTMRYEIGAGNLVRFGPAGGLSGLAGPVSRLQFTCYDACDLDTPITDVNLVRSVKAQATFTNSAALGRDHTFTAQAYLRTNSLGGGGDGVPTVTEDRSSLFEFDTSAGSNHALSQIDATNYLCAYRGRGENGLAVILTVDTGNWTITKGTSFEFDTDKCDRPALARIDATNYLCVYCGWKDDGWAVILTVDNVAGTITMGTPFEFDEGQCLDPAVSQINSTDFLCAYTGTGGQQGAGWAVVLTVDTTTRTITKGPLCQLETNDVEYPALSRIDASHYLCAYRLQMIDGNVDFGRAAVLTVNTVSGVVTKDTDFQFESGFVADTELHRIDQNHYLCAHALVGNAVILTVDTGTWAIGKGTAHRFELVQCHEPALARINETDFLCTYGEFGVPGLAVVLRVDTQADSVTSGPNYMYDEERGDEPALAKVDDSHLLCVYEGFHKDGYAVILKIEASGAVLP
jgi:type II secretory pathway pseudopilin PulG